MAMFYSGVQIKDRKSIFQAHAAKIQSEEEIPALLEELKKDWKIANATFNPHAWRVFVTVKKEGDKSQVKDGKGKVVVGNVGGGRIRKDSWSITHAKGGHHLSQQHSPPKDESGLELEEKADFCCNGEHGAGRCLLSVLRQLDVRGVVIVCSRWKGGSHRIGPVRYRHFAEAAKEALVSGGFVNSSKISHELQISEEFLTMDESGEGGSSEATAEGGTGKKSAKPNIGTTTHQENGKGDGLKRRGYGGKLLKMSGHGSKVHKKGA